jgi:Zn-dependent protease
MSVPEGSHGEHGRGALDRHDPRLGVDVVFGLPDDGINGIMEALRQRQDRIRFVQVRHEEAAAFMACAFAGAALVGARPIVAAILGYLAAVNVLVGAFNLVPGFPLDGGRVLRAILWRTKGNLQWATRIASRAGSTFGLVLIGLGVVGD